MRIRAVMFQRIAILIGVGLALPGCETSGESGTKAELSTIPEYRTHQSCLGQQSAIYSTAVGSPLELGIIASAACNGTRMALYQALAKSEGSAFARAYTETSRREEPKMIAGVIARVKAGQKPF